MRHFSALALTAAVTLFSHASALPWNSTAFSDVVSVDKRGSGPTPIRGVNIGGWLVLEKWMVSDVFDGTNAVDQYTFDSLPGAQAKLQNHWSTFFTEDDVAKIASWGINALRIPIGYWAFDNSGTPYQKGAEDYLDKAIGWARKHGLKVLVDCHGSPGSQNGFDNSGRAGAMGWQQGNNMDHSIDVLKTIATKYGASSYADVVDSIEMVNEPASWGANNFGTTQSWSQRAHDAVKAAATNKNLKIIMHDSFKTPFAWQDIGSTINGGADKSDASFVVDTHLYQNQVAADSLLTQIAHVLKACNWINTDLLPQSAKLPVIVGEFSAATNICANPDGSTLAGSVCYIDGCQCSSNVPIQYWKQPLIDATRKFLEAQLDAFEHSTMGWYIWSYKGPGAWGLANAVQYGLIGQKVTDRKFPNQCPF